MKKLRVQDIQVHMFDGPHIARGATVISLLKRLGFDEVTQHDPPQIRFTNSEPIPGDLVSAIWWGIDHLPPDTKPVSIEVIQRWRGIWAAGMCLLSELDPHVLPPEAQAPFVAFLTAWTNARARWWLRWESQVLLTKRVQTILEVLRGRTREERRLLCTRRAIWREHYVRYLMRHPDKREPDASVEAGAL
jgi:hypothetical protein